jgi:hypothetical protein
LDALAEHLAWIPMAQSLDTSRKTALADRSRRLLATVLDAMEALRQVNNGRLSFMLATSGTPLQVENDGRVTALGRIHGEANFSDLFYAKGLYAAGRVLNLPETCAAAEANLRLITNAIFAGSLASNHLLIDPRVRPVEVPGLTTARPRYASTVRNRDMFASALSC